MPSPFIFVASVFVILHGLVHLLYVGQSQRLFELQPDFDWPAGSWAFARLLGAGATRWLATIAFSIIALGFVVSGVGILTRHAWWHPLAIGSAALSSVMVLLLWNGRLQRLDDQGVFGLLIDAAILVAGLLVRWPSL